MYALARRSVASSGLVAARRGFASSVMARAGDDSTPQAGHTARSSGFSKREKAEEDKYIIEREREKYRKAHEALEKQKADLEKLEKEHSQKK